MNRCVACGWLREEHTEIDDFGETIKEGPGCMQFEQESVMNVLIHHYRHWMPSYPPGIYFCSKCDRLRWFH